MGPGWAYGVRPSPDRETTAAVIGTVQSGERLHRPTDELHNPLRERCCRCAASHARHHGCDPSSRYHHLENRKSAQSPLPGAHRRGCSYPDASNYDAAAVSDDGSCTFDIANPCPADLNGDGSITTGDLLIFLGAFGTIC